MKNKNIMITVLYDSGKQKCYSIENPSVKSEEMLLEDIQQIKETYVYPMFKDAVGYLNFNTILKEQVVVNMQKISEIRFEVLDSE